MKSFTLSTLAFIGTAIALPAAVDPPFRDIPNSWRFDIVALDGPDCGPLMQGDDVPNYYTRTTYGSNTVDGGEIYYWHIAYPGIHAKIAPGETKTLSCEATIQYKEFKAWQVELPLEEQSNYRLNLHKNGTQVGAMYNLGEGVEANWEFTYMHADKKIVDKRAVMGPITANEHNFQQGSDVGSTFGEKIPLSNCGAGIFKFKTALTLTSKGAAPGAVTSTVVRTPNGDQFYGIESGFSYDFARC